MSGPTNSVKLFEQQQVRTIWDETAEKWWFSVLDIITVLTNQPDYEKVRNYWKWLKNKLKEEGSELVSHTNHMLAEVATMDISIVRQPVRFGESVVVAKEGAKAAKVAREQIEKSTGKPAVSQLNAKKLGQLSLNESDENE